MKLRLSKGTFRVSMLAAAIAISGCSAIMSSGADPRVEDCALIQQATPAKFVCNGKTYTAVQLSDLRQGKTPLALK